MLKLLTGKMLPSQLQVFLPVLRRNRSKELPRVKKTLQAESRQLFESHLLGSDTLLVSLQKSQLLSSSWNMYWHGTKVGETNTLFWVSFRKHYAAHLLLLVNHILIWESCFMGSLSSAGNRTWGLWVLLLRAVVTEPQWAQGERMQRCNHIDNTWRLCLLQLDAPLYTDPFCSLKGWSGCPGKWWNHHPWKRLKMCGCGT